MPSILGSSIQLCPAGMGVLAQLLVMPDVRGDRALGVRDPQREGLALLGDRDSRNGRVSEVHPHQLSPPSHRSL